MTNEVGRPRSSWLKRFGLLCILLGLGASVIEGRTPLAAVSLLGGIIVLIEPYLTRRRQSGS